jgi:hypothetical protein
MMGLYFDFTKLQRIAADWSFAKLVFGRLANFSGCTY